MSCISHFPCALPWLARCFPPVMSGTAAHATAHACAPHLAKLLGLNPFSCPLYHQLGQTDQQQQMLPSLLTCMPDGQGPEPEMELPDELDVDDQEGSGDEGAAAADAQPDPDSTDAADKAQEQQEGKDLPPDDAAAEPDEGGEEADQDDSGEAGDEAAADQQHMDTDARAEEEAAPDEAQEGQTAQPTGDGWPACATGCFACHLTKRPILVWTVG